jgi:hypothetical protein
LLALSQVVRDYLGATVAYHPYPNSASFYVAIRNGECDFGVAAVELDPLRVRLRACAGVRWRRPR